MGTMNEGWMRNREEYLKKAYSSVRKDAEKKPLNEVVDNWEMLTDDASKHYLWKALGVFQLAEAVELEENAGQTLIDIDTSVSLGELREDVETVLGDKRNVRKAERDIYQDFEGFEVPVVPVFLASEHMERNSDEVFLYEDSEMRGVIGKETTKNGEKETWLGFYSHDGRKEGSSWLNQVFRGRELEENRFISTEDLFTDQNRQRYTDRIWENRPMKIRQRAYSTWDAAIEAVEEKLPEVTQDYRKEVDRRGWEDLEELEVLKREFRLMAGDDEYDENNPTYIEQIVNDYYEEGLDRDLKMLQPFMENIESRRFEEGDMNLEEATRESDTSRKKKRRNQAYMSHYLDLVWQLSHEKYGEN